MNHSGISADRIQQGRAALRARRRETIKPVPGAHPVRDVRQRPAQPGSRPASIPGETIAPGAQALGAILEMPCSLLLQSEMMGKAALNNQELHEFVYSWAAVINEYFPDVNGGNLMKALLVTGSIGATRLPLILEAIQEQPAAAAGEDNQDKNQPSEPVSVKPAKQQSEYKYSLDNAGELAHWMKADDSEKH